MALYESHVSVLKRRMDEGDVLKEKLIHSNGELQRRVAEATAGSRECVVCLQAARQATDPCGHMILCENCEWPSDVDCRCPVCREEFHGLLRVYL